MEEGIRPLQEEALMKMYEHLSENVQNALMVLLAICIVGLVGHGTVKSSMRANIAPAAYASAAR